MKNSKFHLITERIWYFITESYAAPTDVVHDPSTWNFDSGQLTWKGDLKQIPQGKFQVITKM